MDKKYVYIRTISWSIAAKKYVPDKVFKKILNDAYDKEIEILDHVNRVKINKELSEYVTPEQIKDIDKVMLGNSSGIKSEQLLEEVKEIKKYIVKLIGKSCEKETLKMNWRELQYRNKVTELLGIPYHSSWDVIYNRLISKFK